MMVVDKVVSGSLKNHMEDKQLKFNQPLLSVRRISRAMISLRDEKKKTDNTMRRPPRYVSEIKSGLVGKPGAVPFLWEQIPGRPKDESIPQTQKPPTAPKLPPGRKLQDNQGSDKSVETATSPMGKLQNTMRSFIFPDETVKKTESFDSSKEIRMLGKEKIESEDGDEAYLDALDTLSRTESSFLNCSVSGLGGFDEADEKLSTDPQTKDFMMGRFLPAAKAMTSDKTSETPYYVRKKQLPVQDQQRKLKHVINGDRQPQLRYGPSFTLYHSQAPEYEEEESDDDCCDNGNLSTKICGLFPHFCLKSSSRILNAVPGMNVRTRIPVSPVNKAQTRSSSTASCSGTENEQSTPNVSEQKSVDGSLTAQQHEEKNDVRERANSSYANGLNENKEVDLLSPVIEKTLYIDIVHTTESSAKIYCSPHTEPSNSQQKDIEIITKMIKEKPLVDSSLDSSENPEDDRASLKPCIQRKVDFNPLEKTEALIAASKARDCYQDALTLTKPGSDVREKSQKPSLRIEKLENSYKVHPEFPAPPPLLKSPSDSWLCRTLPSLATKNASSRSYTHTGIYPSDSKWETIVKMTKKEQHV